ncbi:MAG: trimethylamine methyltransferase family protein [Anaerolineae bacterium]
MTSPELRLQILSEAQVSRIEDTAYRLLEEVGISLQHPEARERLHGMGCRVDGERVFIPCHVVDKALSTLRPHTTFYSVDGERSLTLGDGRVRFHNAGGPPFIYDLLTGQRRPAALQDVADAARLLDALPQVDVVMPLCGAQDVPAPLMVIASAEIAMRHTRKPFHAGYVEKPEEVHYLVELAKACCGGEEAYRRRPTIAIMASPVSPLTFTYNVTSAIMAIAASGTPYHSLPAPSLGATSPVTMAGALAQQHAEVLASFVIAASVRPDLPVLYCSRINGLDPRTAISTWGSPEVGITGAGATALAHHRGFLCDCYGFCTSASLLDPQFAYERYNNAFLPALAGADILSGVGVLENNMAVSLEAAVIDDELISLLRHTLRGLEVTDETLAFEVMREAIPTGGMFLDQLHTVRQIRAGAIWLPTVSERPSGAADERHVGVVERARARARELLSTHHVEPLPESTLRQMDEIMQEAKRRLLEE